MLHIWSQTLIVPHNGSPIDWSLWTNSPQPIWSPWTDGPQKFGPHGQMVPNQFGPPRQMVPRILCLSRGTSCDDLKFGDQIGWGPFVQGDQIFGDHLSMGTKFDDCLSRGINFKGIICPGGREAGDQKFGDQMGSVPNASQPFDIKKY